MKKNIYVLLFLLTGLVASKAQLNDKDVFYQTPGFFSPAAIIDSLDTVVFDMSQAVINANGIQFPVYILSDDTVNALDFAFKYDHNNLSYDSIVNLASYIQAYSYYNSTDSTIRYTSNSMHIYANDSALAGIHFTMINGNILNTDINSVVAYLNGDPCPVKIIGLLPNFINEKNMDDDFIRIYSDPAGEILYVESKENGSIQFFGLNGREYIPEIANFNNIFEIYLKGFSSGIYFVRFSGKNASSVRKIVIN